MIYILFLVTCHRKFHVFHKKVILVGHVINQGNKTCMFDQFGSMPVLEEAKTMVYVTNHNMITMAMVIFKTYKMADEGEERVLTEILVYSCFIELFNLSSPYYELGSTLRTRSNRSCAIVLRLLRAL